MQDGKEKRSKHLTSTFCTLLFFISAVLLTLFGPKAFSSAENVEEEDKSGKSKEVEGDAEDSSAPENDANEDQ